MGVSVTSGTASRVNPAWVAAPFEVAFLIARSLDVGLDDVFQYPDSGEEEGS